jgi:hypothetical protein
MRRRIFAVLFSSVVLVMLLPAISFGASRGTEEISGVVTSNGKVVAGAQVIVTCDSNTKKATTDNTGTYVVQYGAAQCPNEATAKVTATYRSQSGYSSGSVKNKNLTYLMNNNLNATPIPGLSLVTGAAAAVLGGVGYIIIRSREISDRKI